MSLLPVPGFLLQRLLSLIVVFRVNEFNLIYLFFGGLKLNGSFETILGRDWYPMPLLSSPKCDACSDICSGLLACCRCRARAVSRIESLQTTSNLETLTLVRCGR